MSSHHIIAEEMGNARRAIDRTLVMLKTQLTTAQERINQAIIQLDEKGDDADLRVLGSMHDHGSAIDQLTRTLEDQKMMIEQSLTYAKLVQKLTRS